MDNLKHGTGLFKKAIEYEETCYFGKAVDYYDACVKCLSLAEKYDEILPSAKDEVRSVLTHCDQRLNELKKFQEQSYNQNDLQVAKQEITYHDRDKENILNCIKSTIRTDTSDISFENICGLPSVIDELEQSVLLEINYPSLFSGYVKPYIGFLLYGVKLLFF